MAVSPRRKGPFSKAIEASKKPPGGTPKVSTTKRKKSKKGEKSPRNTSKTPEISQKAVDSPKERGEKQREWVAARNKAVSASVRDIANHDPPWIHIRVNPDRYEACRFDFKLFCESYLGQTFVLPWSADHLKIIAKIEAAVLHGGLFAMALPRGSGKTSLCEAACLWALIYGHRKFVVLVGSDERIAIEMLDSIKTECESNDTIEEDFSEIVGPIRALEGIHQRAGGQTHQGRQTHIEWTANEIVFPSTVDPNREPEDGAEGGFMNVASGSLIRVAGITGRIRGMKHKRVDGATIRPDLVLIDDPQTDESARSPSQCQTREKIMSGAILGLAGPGKKIAGLVTCTVIREGDLADNILNGDKHPQWQGERTKLAYALPTNEKKWDEYADLWREEMRASGKAARATEFYRANREAMDEGAVMAWPERFNPDELSAVQHAMNLRLDRGESAFWAEYQNEPLHEEPTGADMLTADEIMAKVNGHRRGEIPLGATALTAFIDVQKDYLFWVGVAWEPDFTGYVFDYGTEPDQKVAYFLKRDVRFTLAKAAPRSGFEGSIYAGLERLTEKILGREWVRDDGAAMRIDRCLIDAHWGDVTAVVNKFCRQSQFSGIVIPSHGKYYGASQNPLGERRKQKGDRVGLNWYVPAIKAGQKSGVRYVIFDSNFWKSFIHARLSVPMGDAGCLSLWGKRAATGGDASGDGGTGGSRGRPSNPELHRLIAEHLVSEYPVQTEGRGRKLTEWKTRVNAEDNEGLDCIVGCAVGASMGGTSLREMTRGDRAGPRVRRKVSLAAAMGR